MRLVIGLHERIEIQVRVPLGRREACMPQKFLDGAQVGSGLEQVGRKAVSKRMRARLLLEAQFFSIVF